MDGTEDDIIWEEEAANDGDSNGDLLYPDSDKELRAVFNEESIDEDFLGFSCKASSAPSVPGDAACMQHLETELGGSVVQ